MASFYLSQVFLGWEMCECAEKSQGRSDICNRILQHNQSSVSQMQWNSLSFLSSSKVSMKKSESVSEESRRVAHASDDR